MQSILHNREFFDDTYIVGTADLNGLIHKKFGDYHYGVSIGKRLDDGIVDAIADGPTLAYYEHYNQINHALAEKATEIIKELQKINIDSIVIEPTVSTGSNEFKKYLAKLTVDISHKMVATRAGLGWIGKTDLFISAKWGPRLRLVSILINKKPEKESIPVVESRCGSCSICVESCPAQAATGELWNIRVHRDTFFDAHKCREKCGQLARQKLHIDKRICGICVAVCPIGKKDRNISPHFS